MVVFAAIRTAAKKQSHMDKLRPILLESTKELSEANSKSELELSMSDFEDSDGNKIMKMALYDVGPDFARCDRQCTYM